MTIVDRRCDIHRQIHHRAGGADEDRRHKDLGQVEILISGVEQTLRVGHNGPVDLKQVGKHNAQHTCDQYPQERTRTPRRRTAPLKAVDQGDDQKGEGQSNRQADQDGVPALEVEGDQELPQAEHRQYEGTKAMARRCAQRTG